MPARRSTDGTISSSPRSDNDHQNDEAYKLKRKRNNDAVKKTREKSKQTAQQRKENVEKLQKMNIEMEAQIKVVEGHVEVLKNMLLNNVKPEQREETIKKILEESTDDDDDDYDDDKK